MSKQSSEVSHEDIPQVAEQENESIGVLKLPDCYQGYPWAPQPGHASAIALLHGSDDSVDINDIDEEDDEPKHPVRNFFLLLFVFCAFAAGIYFFYGLSNQSALARRAARAEEKRLVAMEEQLAKQKQYGKLRIESDPVQALILKNGKPIIAPIPGSADCNDDRDCPEAQACDIESKHCGRPARTPTEISDVNITQVDKYTLEKPGYEPFEFYVSEHLWVKDPSLDGYGLKKVIDMTLLPCEDWFIFNAGTKEEERFATRDLCDTRYQAAKTEGLTVTDCTCKPLPDPLPPDVPVPF